MAEGYVYRPKTYRLTFADPDMDGLEIVTRSTSIGAMLTLAGMSELRAARGRFTGDLVGKLREVLGVFADAIVSWNLRDESGPVSATVDAFMGLDIDFTLAIIGAWMEAIGGVPGPLARPSPAGDPLLEESIPMTELS